MNHVYYELETCGALTRCDVDRKSQGYLCCLHCSDCTFDQSKESEILAKVNRKWWNDVKKCERCKVPPKALKKIHARGEELVNHISAFPPSTTE